jgi:hypothetical protein
MALKPRDVKILDMGSNRMRIFDLLRSATNLRQTKDVWRIKGWGLHLRRERIETTAEIAGDGNARR